MNRHSTQSSVYTEGFAEDAADDVQRATARVEHLPEYTENLSMSTVDDTIRANADFHYESGLNPKIVRTSAGRCCEWCSNLAGEYDYV